MTLKLHLVEMYSISIYSAYPVQSLSQHALGQRLCEDTGAPHVWETDGEQTEKKQL